MALYRYPTLTMQVTIDFADLHGDDDTTDKWLESMGLAGPEVPDLTATVDVAIDIDRLDDEIIKAAYEDRFPNLAEAAGRLLTLLAAGEIDLAMEELSREFSLPSPDHEKRIAARIADGRRKEALALQGVLNV